MTRFDLDGGAVVVTGGGGLLGEQHVAAIREIRGTPIALDIDAGRLAELDCPTHVCDVASEESVRAAAEAIFAEHGCPVGLINNAAIDAKFEQPDDGAHLSRLEHFPLEQWDRELRVGLTGTMLCARAFGSEMARHGRGSIVNIASDLGVIAPDQRLYRRDGVADDEQPVKPVTYSVIKHGLLGLTRYLATYWADRGIRCNALAPGGVYNGHDAEFVARVSDRIPMGRMANRDEYRAAIQFLVTDASSYMTGQTLVMDGGRSTW